VLIFFWNSRLARAEVDMQTAFKSLAQVESTLQKLQAAGDPIPWSMPLHKHRYIALHNVAS
jgi:hypothetical protein